MSGWNGSSSTGQAAQPQRPVKSGGVKPAVVKGIVGGLAVVVAALAVGYFVLFGDKAAPEKESVKKSAAIKEVTPAAAPKAEVVEEKPKPKFWEVDASQTNGFSEVMQHKWRVAHRPKPAHTNRLEDIRHRARSSIFRYRSENFIAALLTAKPGETMLGTPNLRGISEDFMKSCEEPILVTEDDDDYNRDLKKMMNETKIELRQRMKDGEKLEDILTDTRKELQRLSICRQEMQQEIAAYRREGDHTDQDVADFVAAANKILESKGVTPIELSPIIKSRLKHLNQQSEGEKK